MERKHIEKLAKDPRYIPCIYNYCDRWCERCQFTSRCLTREAIGINDATEIIRWYQYQIMVKFKRAIRSAYREESSDLDDFPKDSDGSAKVSLIGIDRSTSAWKILLTCFPKQEKQILNLIEVLENIKNRVETQFPHARNFMRPGFDKIGVINNFSA